MNLRRGREDDRHRRYLKIKKIKKGLEIYPMGVYNGFRIKKVMSAVADGYKDGSAAGVTAESGKETGRWRKINAVVIRQRSVRRKNTRT